MIDITIIEEMWDILKLYIPEKDRQVAADHLIPAIIDYDLPDSEFKKFVKTDHYLEVAAQEFLDSEDDDDYDDDDEDDEY